MADLDDWEAFKASTKEDPEEVETPEEDETKDPQEDPKSDPKKSKKDEGEDPESGGEDPKEDPKDDPAEDPKDPKDPKPTEEEYTPRLKQFLNKDGALKVKDLEDAYVESGKEAVKLNEKVQEIEGNYNKLLDAIKAKPEVAKALFGEDGAKELGESETPAHPLLQHLDAEIKKRGKEEYDEFVEAHPEAVTDPEKARKIGEYLKFYGAWYRETNDGRIPTMKEGLEAAYRHFNWDLKIKQKEEVANAAKQAAASKPAPTGTKPKAKKSEVRETEQFFADKLGVKLRAS